MEVDVEALDFNFLGNPEADDDVDDLQDDVADDAGPHDRGDGAFELGQELPAVTLEDAGLALPPNRRAAKTPVRMAPTKPPTP